MGKFYNASITSDNPQEIAARVSNFFNDLDGVTSEVIEYTYNSNTYYTADIKIDGTDIEMYCGYRKDGDQPVYVNKVINGDITYIGDYVLQNYNEGPTRIVSAYIDDDCIMLYSYAKFRNTYSGTEVVYVKTSNNKHLVGYYRRSDYGQITDNFLDISSLSFEELNDTARIVHTYTNMFPYTATAGTIDFTNEAFFVNNGYKKFTVPVLKECSTVPLGSTQSLPVSNYIALGAHCLAPLDE